MRSFLLALPLLAALPLAARADDDTEHFLKPQHWEGLMDYWKIDGTTVTGTSPRDGLKSNTFLCSKKKYKDFKLKFEIRLGGGDDANSGVQIRSQLLDTKHYAVGGPQCDVGAGYWGSLYGERFGKDGKIGGGHMMKMADAKAVNAVLKKGHFNDYSIKCVGKHVKVVINEVTTVDDDFDIMPDEGIIAFQLHVTKTPMDVTFKNIEFKDLSK